MNNSPHEITLFSSAKVIGYLIPSSVLPTFALPIVAPFSSSTHWPNLVYIQQINALGLVEDFQALRAPLEMQKRLEAPYAEVAIGDHPIHVVISPTGEPTIGPQKTISPIVKSWLPDLMHQPLTRLAFADFCGDEDAAVSAASDAFQNRVRDTGSETAVGWFNDTIVFRRVQRAVLKKAANSDDFSKVESELEDVLIFVDRRTLQILAPPSVTKHVTFERAERDFRDALLIASAVGANKLDFGELPSKTSHQQQRPRSGKLAGRPKHAVMLSSTYKELADHRRAVEQAILGQELFPVAMDNDAALPDHDLISASLAKVEEADAYVGLISYRYGQMPHDADRNPNGLSLTELEFRRALDRKIPICMFIMHDDHAVPRSAVTGEGELERTKLKAFIELTKKDRIYAEFKSVDDLKAKAVQSLVKLRETIGKRVTPVTPAVDAVWAEPKSLDIPSGWEIVDREALAKIRANPPPLNEMVQFFDGILPTWRFALAHGVQPRAITGRLASRLHAIHAGAAKPEVVLLAGAGGEGKSTAVLHAAAALVEDRQQAWTCLHRKAANAELPEDTFAKLPTRPDHAWVVVIDDADNIGPAILAAVKKVAARTDVHVLLAARDADWHLKRLVPGMWQPFADFHTELLAGLDPEDARRIVAGWAAWGNEAMGKLKGRSEDDAVTALLGYARDFATRKEDGELLGALLITRTGGDMRAHVRTLVNSLGPNPVIKTYSLRNIYAMVAAMHAENQLYLSEAVLAFALGCDVDQLERNALLPLRREAMLDSGDTYVLTRHRLIAEVACTILREDDEDVGHWYSFLTRAAMRAYAAKAFFVTDLQSWNYDLARYFLQKGQRRWPVARNVAKAVFEGNPEPQNLTTFVSILRRTGQATEAIAALKIHGERFRNDRAMLYEWGTIYGELGEYGLNAWLGGRTLADGGPLEPRQCKLSLAGLGVAFNELFEATREKAFAAGQAACGQLGLRLEVLDATARGYFEKHAAEGRRNGIADLSPGQAVDAVRKAMILGANDVEPDNDPVFFERLLGEPDGYRYTTLLRMVGGSKATPASQRTKEKPGRRK